MVEFYELAGIRIKLQFPEKEMGSRDPLADYMVQPGGWLHSYSTEVVDRLDEDPGTVVFRQGDFCVSRSGPLTVRYIGAVEKGVQSATFRICRTGAHTQLQYCRSRLHNGVTARLLIQGLELEHLLTLHNGFLLHASFIEHEGRAILFTAPSETGKSTQAKLWCDHAGAELVNGDRAAVRLIDGEVCACGIPFSGSSPVRRNVTLPLKAIVYLSQAPENTIHRLWGVRAFRRVWEGCTVNTWDREDVEKATKTVGDVVSRIPIYLLACTPDVRAVELLKHTMEVGS